MNMNQSFVGFFFPLVISWANLQLGQNSFGAGGGARGVKGVVNMAWGGVEGQGY